MLIQNNLDREFTKEEIDQVEYFAEILETEMKQKIFKFTVNPQSRDKRKIYGYSIAFDLKRNGGIEK